MVTTRRRKSLTVIQQLLEEPQRFDFFQSVRLLERSAALNKGEKQFATEPVAHNSLPNREVVRFHSTHQMSFKGSDLDAVSVQDTEDCGDSNRPDKQWAVGVNFMGLTGSQGVMPYYLTELVLQELKQKNSTLGDFLNLFNHRSISLFFKAWHKYQLPANVERNHQQSLRLRHKSSSSKPQRDLFSDALLSLAGLGTSELNYRLPMADEALAGFSGSLSRSIRTADELKGMIQAYFDIEVEIEQFQGQWQELPVDIQTRLPGEQCPKGMNNQLGTNAVLGESCFQIQNKFSVVVAPMPYDSFMELAPGSKKLEALKSFVHFSVGSELDFDIEVTLLDVEVPPAQLTDTENYQPLLGWNSHLSHSSDEENLTKIKLSQELHAPDDSLPMAS